MPQVIYKSYWRNVSFILLLWTPLWVYHIPWVIETHVFLFRNEKRTPIFWTKSYSFGHSVCRGPQFYLFPFFLSLPLLSSLGRPKLFYKSHEVSYYYFIIKKMSFGLACRTEFLFFFLHIFIDNTMQKLIKIKMRKLWELVSRFIGWSLTMTINIIWESTPGFLVRI